MASAPTRTRIRSRYGPLRHQVGDLWLPASRSDHSAKPPVVVLIHGGFWRSVYTKSLMDPLARAVVERGWAAWNIEYRRIGLLGGSRGWPATFEDVAAAVDHVAAIEGVDGARVCACGHSAGGQLAFWASARNGTIQTGPADPGSNASPLGPKVAMRAVVSLAGVLDLEAAARTGIGAGAVKRLLEGAPDEVPARYAECSPSARLPLGTPQLVVHGELDDVVPPSMSAEYAVRATEAGDDVVYEQLAGQGHREMIDPKGPAWQAVAGYLAGRLET